MNKLVITLIVLFITLVAFTVAAEKEESYYQQQFSQWVQKYPRKYYNKSQSTTNNYELSRRYQIFKDNLILIERHNSNPEKTYTLGLNDYADMTWEEFQEYFRLREVNANAPQFCSATKGTSPLKQKNVKIPTHVDWREKGIVTPVKNQRNCGSCWTFSSTGAIESYYASSTGRLVSLSEQQLVDCAGYDNHGCRGGLPSSAFTWLANNGGIQPDISYPYEGIDNKCRFDKNMALVQLRGSMNITQGDEEEMERVMSTMGVVSIAYQVVNDFRFYTGGVYKSSDCKQGPMDVNHAVLAVGLGVQNETLPYWIVKNSWGPSFGINGYFLIERGTNMCGLATCSSYPLLD